MLYDSLITILMTWQVEEEEEAGRWKEEMEDGSDQEIVRRVLKHRKDDFWWGHPELTEVTEGSFYPVWNLSVGLTIDKQEEINAMMISSCFWLCLWIISICLSVDWFCLAGEIASGMMLFGERTELLVMMPQKMKILHLVGTNHCVPFRPLDCFLVCKLLVQCTSWISKSNLFKFAGDEPPWQRPTWTAMMDTHDDALARLCNKRKTIKAGDVYRFLQDFLPVLLGVKNL